MAVAFSPTSVQRVRGSARLWMLLSAGMQGCLLFAEPVAPDDSRQHEDVDNDGLTTAEGDCNDHNPNVHPDATEVCDAVDNDCDGLVDDADDSLDSDSTPEQFTDADGDGFGNYAERLYSCEAVAGASSTSGDCNDANPSVSPAASELCDGIDNNCDSSVDDATSIDATAWYIDADADGFGTDTDVVWSCTPVSGRTSVAGDCDDTRADRYPGAEESDCTDPTDYNCDGSSAYDDADSDGFPACEDCNDLAADVYPDAPEYCDEVDRNCDGDPLDDSALDRRIVYADADGDGFGDPSVTDLACVPAGGQSLDNTDCDDTNSAIHPDAAEVCDPDDIDEDCDAQSDDNDPSVDAATFIVFYVDADSDGFGDPAATEWACDRPTGTVTNSLDCDDTSSAISPAEDEVCDPANVDEDCNGLADDLDPGVLTDDMGTWYTDGDGDGYGDATAPVTACDQPMGSVRFTADCDDTDSSIYPDGDDTTSGLNGDFEGFPQVGGLWLNWDLEGAPTWCEAASFTAWIDGGGLDAMVRRWPDDVSTTEEASALLHDLNPNLVLYQSILVTEYSPGSDLDPDGVASCWDPATDVLTDMYGSTALTAYGNEVANILSEDTRACVLDFDLGILNATSRWSSTATYDIYDGAFLTSSSTGADHIYYGDTSGHWAFDGCPVGSPDGVEDTEDEFKQAWANGVVQMITLLLEDSTLASNDVPLMSSGSGLQGSRYPLWGRLHGTLTPSEVRAVYEQQSSYDPEDAFLEVYYAESVKTDNEQSLGLTLMMGDSAVTDVTDPSTVFGTATYIDQQADYARMRYGLAMALLTGRAFSYEWGNAGHGQGWWYDEFDGGGEGMGYLGQPIGLAEPYETTAGTELLTNSGFDSSLSGWSAWTCNAATDSSCSQSYSGNHGISFDSSTDVNSSGVSGSLKLVVEQDEDVDSFVHEVTVYSDEFSASRGDTLLLRFSAKTEFVSSDLSSTDAAFSNATHGTRAIQPVIQCTSDCGSAYLQIDALPWVVLDDEWRSFELEFDLDALVPSTADTLYLYFAVGNHDGTVWFDDVSLQRNGSSHPVWFRRFDEGIVLLNSGTVSETIDLTDIESTTTWRHLSGTQDPVVNSGLTGVTSTTVPGLDGLILIRE